MAEKGVEMETIKVNYDSEEDILLIHKAGEKSQGAIEIGDFIIDFSDNMAKAIAVEILNASEVLQIKKEFLENIKTANIKTINKGDTVYVYYSLVAVLGSERKEINNPVTIPLVAAEH